MKVFEINYITNEGEEHTRVGARSEQEAFWLAKCQDVRFKKIKGISFLNKAKKEEVHFYLSQISFYKNRK